MEDNNLRSSDYITELENMVVSLSPLALKEKIQNYHENDIAQAMKTLDKEKRVKIDSVLSDETLSKVIEYADEDQSLFLDDLSVKRRISILEKLETDTVALYLKNLSRGERQTIVEFLDDDAKNDLALLNSFTDDELGSKMSTNFIKVQQGCSVKEAMKSLIEQASENDNIQTLYVVKDDDYFYGAIDLKDLIRARSEDLEAIISTSYPYVYGTELIEDDLSLLKEYAEDSIPVLDNSNRLIGAITSKEIQELVGSSMLEDYARFASLTRIEDLNESVGTGVKKRLPWLLILLILGTLVSSVIGLFEKIAASITILVAFQSLILDMAGNAGTQSLSVTIRILGVENLGRKEKRKLILRETKAGLYSGILLAIASFIFAGLYVYLFTTPSLSYAFSVSLSIAISLIISIVISSIMGVSIPLIFKKLNIDPAVASGPFITTLNDLVGAVTYYSVAFLLLIH